MVTERLMKAGQWDLKLSKSTPKAIRDALDYWGHVYVFGAPMRDGQGDATMIAASRWGGIVRRRKTPFDVGGTNMIAWLGDEDGKGPIIEAAVTQTAASFATWVAAIRPAAVGAGTISAVAGTLTNTYQWVTPRAALDNLAAYFNAEYRVNKDATLDAGAYGTSLFNWTPTAIAMRLSSGRDMNVVGIHTTELAVSIDSEEYFDRVLVKDASGTWTNAPGTATPYKDLHGNALAMTKAVTSSLTPTAAAASLAANLVASGQTLRQEVTLSTDEFDISRDVKAGDSINVYDPQSNLVDTTNPVRFRGTTVYPIKLRVMAATWPIERGMGVWYRSKLGVWTDLTRFIEWESAGVSFEVGVSSRALLTTP